MLLSGEAFDDDERARLYPAESAKLCATADTFFTGASYQWGGVTPWGCDCSGVVQAVAALHDLRLPRDAWQQALEGELVHGSPLDIDALQPFDLLFFSDREDQRVTHVGMALESGRMLHSALARGGVHIESLHSDDSYVARLRAQFLTARRVIAAPAHAVAPTS
jgi:cell wall-associated NlpC family hydrolase